MTKGFVTVVTGEERYYRIALNLLYSYRLVSKSPLPFCVITDEGNPYINEFDDYAIMSNPANSFMNKLKIYDYLPYDENIFIDADSLAYTDLNILFDSFSSADDFSSIGWVLPKEDPTGIFVYDSLVDLKPKVNYNVDLHGGLYFIRKSPVSEKIFRDANNLLSRFYEFKFRELDFPTDEALFALSMALNNCRPVENHMMSVVAYYPMCRKTIRCSLIKQRVRYVDNDFRPLIVHWGNRNLTSYKYKIQLQQLNYLKNKTGKLSLILSCAPIYVRQFIDMVREAFQIHILKKISDISPRGMLNNTDSERNL